VTLPFSVTVPNWPALVKSFSKAEDTAAAFARLAYLCRGQACAEWDLRPSLSRVLQEAGITDEDDARAVERTLVRAFQKRAHEYLASAVMPDNRETASWWVIMQHYGAPTRVLDWTASAYVATYFAVESRTQCDCAVWLIHPLTIIDHFYPPPPEATMRPESRRVNIMTAPPEIFFFAGLRRLTDRMESQQTEPALASRILADQATFIGEAIPEVDASEKFVKLIISQGAEA